MGVKVKYPHWNPSEVSMQYSDLKEAVDRYFRISERGSTISTEIKGGIVTFLSMSYILAVNPDILGPAAEGYEFSQLFTATALSACVACLLMGLYARFPVALAPGMGLNAMLSYTICLGMGFTYEQGLFIVFLSGAIFLAVTVSGYRDSLIASIPASLKIAISAGIGFFVALIGLYNSGIVVHGSNNALAPGDLTDPGVLLAVFCTILTVCLWYKKKWYSIILGLALTWVIGVFLFEAGVTSDIGTLPDISGATGISVPDIGIFGRVFTGFEMFPASMWVAFISAVLSMFVVEMFDTTGTLLAASDKLETGGADSKDGLSKAMKADAASVVFGSVSGTSTTSYVESFTGIEAGARSGLMAVVVGLLFAVAMVFSGIFSTFTAACTAGALILVGLIMVSNIRRIEWEDSVLCFASLITIFMMGLAGSITDGIGIGLAVYVIGCLVLGRRKEIKAPLWAMFFIFMASFVINAIII